VTQQSDLGIYPDEEAKLKLAYAELSRRFEFEDSWQGDSQRAAFNEVAHTEFAKAGFVVTVEWKQIVKAKTGEETGVWIPKIIIEGRTRPEEETDHDRFQWGVVKGLADGQAGYVREDGSRREDPKSKIILPKGNL
jgi:hypothetical protein